MQRYQALNIMGLASNQVDIVFPPHEEIMLGLVYYSSSVFLEVNKLIIIKHLQTKNPTF